MNDTMQTAARQGGERPRETDDEHRRLAAEVDQFMADTGQTLPDTPAWSFAPGGAPLFDPDSYSDVPLQEQLAMLRAYVRSVGIQVGDLHSVIIGVPPGEVADSAESMVAEPGSNSFSAIAGGHISAMSREMAGIATAAEAIRRYLVG